MYKKVLSSYQHLGNTAWSSILTSWERASIHDIPTLVHWFLLDVPVVPVLLTFHALFAATQTAKPAAGRHFWFKSWVLTVFAAFGGSTMAAVFSGAPPPLFTTGSNYMLGYVTIAWYLVHHVPLLQAFLQLRPIAAVLAFGAQAAKARSIFAFVDAFVGRFPGAAAGAMVLGGLAGSGGSLFVAFERKLRLGSAATSELSKPGWGFKSAYIASVCYYIGTDPDFVFRSAVIPLRKAWPRDRVRFTISICLCCHAFIEALIGRHINPMYLFENAFYAVTRFDRSDKIRPTTSAKNLVDKNLAKTTPVIKRARRVVPQIPSTRTSELRQRNAAPKN